MKLFFSFVFLFSSYYSSNLFAEVSRSPAVVKEICDLEIPTTQVKADTEKTFEDIVVHQVGIQSDDLGCSVLPKKRFPDSTYEEYARQEMKVLFQKYPGTYTKKCFDFYNSHGFKPFEYDCVSPTIDSIKLSNYSCNKRIEDATNKISYVAIGMAEIKFHLSGKRIEEKSATVVQKEQCLRVNECMETASDKEMPELQKLAAVACKGELTPVNTARAPAIEKDSSFNGNRNPKTNDKSQTASEVLEHTTGK